MTNSVKEIVARLEETAAPKKPIVWKPFGQEHWDDRQNFYGENLGSTVLVYFGLSSNTVVHVSDPKVAASAIAGKTGVVSLIKNRNFSHKSYKSGVSEERMKQLAEELLRYYSDPV